MSTRIESDEGTTQAISSLRISLIGVTIANILAIIFAKDIPWIVALPCIIINMCFLQITPLHGLIFSMIEIAWMMTIFYPVKYFFNIPWAFALLFLYSPIAVILFRKRKDYHNPLSSLFIRYIWDPPLLMTIWFIGWTNLGGDRFLFPFATVIDEHIVMGSLPLPWDVQTMVKDYNIAAVVNMTIEYAGPVEAYEEHGIVQLQLKTVDTSSPTLAQVHRGVEFIEKFIRENPGKRVFIHCKGGRGRAAIMTACYLIRRSQGEEHPRQILKRLKEKRHVVSASVWKYPTVLEYYDSHRTSTQHKGQEM